MRCWRSRNRARYAMTLVEMLVSMAILVVVFAAVVPQLRAIQTSWASKRGNTEAIQNGRVLMDHITFNLTQANKVTAVSGSAETNGYIEFEDNDSNTMRYQIGAGNYVEFGVVGDLNDLAGPVSQLQFTCYDACDLDTPITEVNDIRCIKVQATVTNSAELGRNQTFTAQAYLRTNASTGGGGGGPAEITKGTPFEFETILAATPALSQIDNNHYLLAYTGGADKDYGWAVVLTVNTGTWTITKETPLLVDEVKCKIPAVARIDSTHHLYVYEGNGSAATAVVLTVNTVTWIITKGTPLVFDAIKGKMPALSQIDGTHYLCAYSGNGDDGYAVVLTVDTGTWEITAGTAKEFDELQAKDIAMAQIDSTHYLCAYEGGAGKDEGWAVVLTVDTGTWEVTNGTLFEYENVEGEDPALAQIDSTHYLCAYLNAGKGLAAVLTVNTGTGEITKGTPYEYDSTEGKDPALAQIDSTNYLCAYDGGSTGTGWSAILTVDTGTWAITKAASYEYDTTQGETPALAQIDSSNYLCAYEGEGSGGYAVVLKPSLGGGGGEVLP